MLLSLRDREVYYMCIHGVIHNASQSSRQRSVLYVYTWSYSPCFSVFETENCIICVCMELFTMLLSLLYREVYYMCIHGVIHHASQSSRQRSVLYVYTWSYSQCFSVFETEKCIICVCMELFTMLLSLLYREVYYMCIHGVIHHASQSSRQRSVLYVYTWSYSQCFSVFETEKCIICVYMELLIMLLSLRDREVYYMCIHGVIHHTSQSSRQRSVLYVHDGVIYHASQSLRQRSVLYVHDGVIYHASQSLRQRSVLYVHNGVIHHASQSLRQRSV